MPLFKRKQAGGHRLAAAEPTTPALCGPDEIRAVPAWHVERATRAGSSFTVLFVIPQVLPGERISAPEARVVSSAILDQLREGDHAGAVADDAFVVVLARTGPDEAQIVAHRLATEFTIRSARVRQRNWRVGIAIFPDDGTSPEALTAAALAHARGTRAA